MSFCILQASNHPDERLPNAAIRQDRCQQCKSYIISRLDGMNADIDMSQTQLFNTITNKRIAVLGFAFKKNTGDTRASPAISLVKSFRSENAKISIYDPKVPEAQIWSDVSDPLVAGDKEVGEWRYSRL